VSLASLKIGLADAAARSALRFPVLERLLARGCNNELLRRHLHLGAVAIGYSRVAKRRELRIANMGAYRFYVNVSEPLGIHPYFFRDSGAVWLTTLLVRPGDACIDAGANVGHYTFLTASKVGPTGRVFAFEPNPAFTEIIRRSIALNDYASFVSVESRALWNCDGEEKTFFVSINPSNTGTSTIIDKHTPDLPIEDAIKVTTTTLDTFALEKKLDHLRFVKIDVEHAEQYVLEGAKTLLSNARIDFLIIEMYSASASQALLEGHGYRGFRLDSDRSKLVPIGTVETTLFSDYLWVSPKCWQAFQGALGSWVE
jgi:FkbM family methyltransferase